MTTTSKIATLAAGLALAATPAFGHGRPPSQPAHPTHPATPQSALPGPSASFPAKAKAYGARCQNQSKKHVQGQKGTPFSQCVTSMAKAAHTTAPTTTTTEQTAAARSACKGMSKKHAAHQSGTPFSKCVSSAAKLLKALHPQS